MYQWWIYSKSLALAIVVGVACLLSPQLYAACSVVKRGNDVTVNFGVVTVSPGAANGAVLASRSASASGWRVKCPKNGGSSHKFNIWAASASSGPAGVFNTAIPGVGFTLMMDSVVANDGKYVNGARQADGSYIFNVPSAITVKLIKYGPVGSGRFSGRVWGRVNFGSGSPIYEIRAGGGAGSDGTSVVVPTCSAIGAQTIDLGRLSAKTISSNTTAGDKLINITMNCGSGLKVYAKLSGTAVTGATGLIRNQGTATGVAVQLIDSNKNPIPLGNTTQLTNNGANTTYTMGARAYKTGTVGAGTINAQATLTVTYQ